MIIRVFPAPRPHLLTMGFAAAPDLQELIFGRNKIMG